MIESLRQNLRVAARGLRRSPGFAAVAIATLALGCSAADEGRGITEVVVLSDAIWRRRFAGSPDAVGRKLKIDNDWYTAIGALAALAASRLLTGPLYDIRPTDPVTYTLIAMLLALTGAAAAWRPARHAAAIDPIAALRATDSQH